MTTMAEPLLRSLAVEPGYPTQGEWTYADYERLPEDGWRYEVIRGELFMAPAPSPRHQAVIRNFTLLLGQHLAQHPGGRFYFAPIDLILPNSLASPVQPDLVYLSPDQLPLVKQGRLEGAPALIVEVLSPGNWWLDRRTKFEAYREAGVAEYWLIDPQAETVEVFSLGGGGYELLGRFVGGETATSRVLAGFGVGVGELFAES